MRNNTCAHVVSAIVSSVGIALLVMSSAGCESPAPAATKNYKPLAAAILATELGDAPQPTPAPAPSPGGKCDNCNGKGKLGDGVVSVTCPVCGGDGVKSQAADTSPQATDIAPAATPDITSDCPCLDCTCDPCTCQAVAKAEPTYAPEQINGEWYCTHNGQRLKWTAVRCYGPGLPCDYEWRPAPSQSNSSASLTSSPACATGNCGVSTGRTIRRPRGFFGRR